MKIYRCLLMTTMICISNCAKAKELHMWDPKDEMSKQIKTHSYLICTGEIDLERLTTLNKLYNPSSLAFMKIEPGMKILTLGCGIGLLEMEMVKQIGTEGKILATDISPLQLAMALKNTEQASGPNLVFKELDLAHLNSISERFDRIHCRFVLSHMPWESIEKLLPLLMSKITPSGALVIEEITTIDSLTSEPFSEEYELWKTYVNKQFAIQGSDRSPGKRLCEHLKKQGYNFDYQTHQPILKEKRDKQILSLGIRSIAQGLIDKKAAFPEELLEAIEKLKKLEEDPSLFPRYCEISQFFITPSDKKKFIDQFFSYLTVLGNPKNPVDLNALQSFVTPDFTVQSNNAILSQVEEPIILEEMASIHFQIECTEQNGNQKKLDAMAILNFKEGKINHWTETVYEEPYFNHALFPIHPPLSEGYLPVSNIHTLFYATYGNPKGIPIVVLHGGPGEGCSDELTRFFDLNRYYVVMFDQRGSKRSTPFASMEENTPENSIKDIEILRQHLGIEKWLVLGGSWGSTLAILYGQSHPECCEGFILKGIFLGREQDYLHLLYGMGELSPKAYSKFLHYLPEEEHFDLLSAYHQRIMDPNPEIYMPASRAFIEFDATCVNFFPSVQSVENALKNDPSVYSVSKHFFHYSMNKFFLRQNQILSNMDKIKHLPAILIHGKHDIVTLPENAYKLHEKWDNSTLWMIPQGGHSSGEPAIAAAIATALDFFADRME